MDKQLEHILTLRKNGQLEEANQCMVALVKEQPQNAYYQFQCAWTFDSLGQEKEAVPHYEEAIKLGLEAEVLVDAYLGLGSTYRTIGQYEQAKRIFEQAIQEFPKAEQIKVFYAMTLYNLGEHAKSMETLLNTILRTANHQGIQDYKKAIHYYSDKLDQTWL
ncbi:tetratricopeptide repeat protein [Lysinibacillus sp. OL1_EC]|uniref:tetratricopeptide repeat protein n=1 Tax=unclassified Lysinibacillus TaxID=2636778 RepID=UPI00103C0ADC|nr:MULTISPECIES: tetratricopeptide repeat protein [unclassified Lysinibacillus]MCM0624131.1 tetratricopeptide repeat protein [Lysinibacillus sp. OL1_EC]MCS5501410.1 tetratricopeptide repeat protein [Lysinibacillus sp. A4]TBV88712.1 tetratricopeptide repeat protein [Lysinibacillus sp. OL1]UKJ43589.1 tetratricopeptide repeat protein [Lysinibacillus sp. ACHW1.5]WGT37220.1 tetratricopeptide repeat protein [Lysinibacillus sp. 1 U-2021]